MSDYDIIEVPAGQTRRFNLGSGDSLENTLIDITADGAEYRINCSGDGWAIRNVGIRGRMTNGAAATPWTMRGNGTVEHVYLGDGGERNGMFVLRQHAGRIDIDRAYIANFHTNGLYASPPGNGPEHKAPGGGGDVVVTNSYGKDNRIANFRLGTDGSRLESSVSIGGMRPYWGYYHDTTLVDCDITGGPIVVGDTNYQTGKEATVTAENCRYDVNVARASPSNDFTGEPQGDPDTSVPAGVPTSAAEAASGGGDTGNEDDSSMSDYNTITVPAGQTRRFNLGSGDSLENTLIDITASGASYRINCKGNGWAVRNVGVKGHFPSSGATEPFTVQGTGTIENLYLGDGGSGGATGIFVMRSHSGHIDARNLYLEGWTDNGFYGSACGNGSDHSAPGGQGTITIEDSYSANNRISNFRLGTDGSKLTNCVMEGGAHRSYWAYYGDTELIDCDITGAHLVVGESLYARGRNASVTARNCRYDVNVSRAASSCSFTGRSQGSPDTTLPAGVPTSAEQAASGGGADTGRTGGGGVEPHPDDEYDHTLVVRGADELAEYAFQTDGETIDPHQGGSATFDPEDDISVPEASGTVHGGVDAFDYDGELVALEVAGPATFEVDGTEINPADYPTLADYADDATDGGDGEESEDDGGTEDGENENEETDTMHTLVLRGSGAKCDYEFTVSGDTIEATEEEPWWSFNRRDKIDGNTASGRVIGGADAYLFEGDLETITLDGPYDRVLLDGEEIDPADYTETGDEPDESRGAVLSHRVSASGDGESEAVRLAVPDAGSEKVPSPVSVMPRSAAASSDFYITEVTREYVELTYHDALPAGEDNLRYQVTVEYALR